MNHFSRRTLGKGLFGASLLSVMGAAAGCTTQGQTPNAGATGGAAATGGVFTMAVDVDPLLNPARATSAGSQQIFCQAVFDTLLRFEPDGEIVPGLAESYEMAEDRQSLTLVLRDGLRFSDGTPLDAEAVKKYIDYHKEAGGSDASRSQPVTVEVTDERSLLMTTAEPYPLLPMFLCLSVGSVAAPAQIEGDADTTPIGAGPYSYEAGRSTTGSTYTLVRNPNYHDAAAFPYDEVVFRVITDITARLSALQTGQANAGPLNTQTAAAAEGAGLELLRNPANWAGLIIADRLGEAVPALGDVRVRRAMNMAFDREAILRSAEQGEGEVTNQIFSVSNEAHRADMTDLYPFDVEGARALMAEAGYADGFDVEIPFIEGFSNNNPIVISSLGEIGIRVSQRTVAGQQGFLSILSGEFPLMWVGLETRNVMWDMVQGIEPGAIWNLKKQTTPELEQLCHNVLVASESELDAAAQALGEYLIDEAWFAPVYFANSIFALDATTTAENTVGSGYPYFPTYAPRG